MASYFSLDDGTKIAYTLTGSGPSVVLLHCWLGNSGFWNKQVPVLTEKYKVVALDFRGHGESDLPDKGYTLEQLADDVHQVIQGLGLAPTAFVGHSMGGMVAQHLAIRHQEDVSLLILITTVAADPDRSLTSPRILDSAHELGFERALRKHTVKEWFTPDSPVQLVEWIYSELMRTPEKVALALADSVRTLDIRNHLPTILIPTLVVGSSKDGATPPKRTEEIAQLIPGAEHHVIRGTGHFIQFENSEEVTRLISDFLSKKTSEYNLI